MNIQIGTVWQDPAQTLRVKIIGFLESFGVNGYHVVALSERNSVAKDWLQVKDPRCQCIILDPSRCIEPSLAELNFWERFTITYPICGVYHLWSEVPRENLLEWERIEGVFPACCITRLARYLDTVLRNKYWQFPHTAGSYNVERKILCVFPKYVPGVVEPVICVVVERLRPTDESLIEVPPGTIFVPVKPMYPMDEYYQI